MKTVPPTLDYSALFAGELQFFPASPKTRDLARFARSVVSKHFGERPLSLPSAAFREALLSARSAFETESTLHYAQEILRSVHAGQGVSLDKVRLRAITPGLEAIDAAAPVFFGHRDTWYGNPKCQINAWLPLQMVNSSNSFRFFTDYFNAKILNDSSDFKAQTFRTQGGFGRLDSLNPSVYPKMLHPPQGDWIDIEMEADQLLAFSAAHLHQTLPNRTSQVRFSLDFRFFRTRDLKRNQGAPDLDNESSGLLIEDYTLCDC